jgi:hypothetical protein
MSLYSDSSHATPQEASPWVGKTLKDCLEWRKNSDLPEPVGVDTVIHHFQWACKANGFRERFVVSGFTNPSFHPSTHLSPCVPAYDKFEQGLADVHPSCALGVVFHGTPPENVLSILHNGLDPNKRMGQAYGPGEYFSKEPGLSVSFCRGGLEVLVFVVMVVPSLTTQNTVFPKVETSRRPRFRGVPPDYVVVENNCYQIPIGTMKFEAVDTTVLRNSRNRRKNFLALSHEVAAASQVAKETQLKAQIIQDLITNQVLDVASDRYQKHRNSLLEVSRREISWYVHQNVDKEVMSFYFEDLPEPLSVNDMATVNIQSLDDATRREQQAKQRLEDAKMKKMPSQPPPSVRHPYPDPGSPQQRVEDAKKNKTRPPAVGNPHHTVSGL